MLIGRDPFIFSIVLEPVKEWNRINDKYDFTFCNGIMQFSFLGKLFPYNEFQNITLECAVNELIKAFKNIPVDDDIYYEPDIESAIKRYIRVFIQKMKMRIGGIRSHRRSFLTKGMMYSEYAAQRIK